MTVGDVNSAERGSGARFNTGKPSLELIPLRLIARSYSAEPKLTGGHAACLALDSLGRFQERRDEPPLPSIFRNGGNDRHLIAAIQFLDHDGNAWAECAHVFDYGRKKYAAWNWAKGMAWSIPIACAGRHLLAILRGEETDPESGLPHRGHVMCNLVMALTFLETYPEGDDRMPASVFNPPGLLGQSPTASIHD